MVVQFNPALALGKAIKRNYNPSSPAMMEVPLDFSSTIEIDISMNIDHGIRNVQGIGGIQSMFVDNSNNGNALTMAFDNNPTMIVPPRSQAVFPVFFSGTVLSLKVTTLAQFSAQCAIWFLNTKENPAIWSSLNVAGTVIVTGTVSIAGVVTVDGSVTVLPVNANFTDSSKVLTTGGTSQQLIAAASVTTCYIIRNPATPASQGIGGAPEPVYLNWGAPAVVDGPTSWELLPGESFFSGETNGYQNQQINWTAATAGHQLICKFA